MGGIITRHVTIQGKVRMKLAIGPGGIVKVANIMAVVNFHEFNYGWQNL